MTYTKLWGDMARVTPRTMHCSACLNWAVVAIMVSYTNGPGSGTPVYIHLCRNHCVDVNAAFTKVGRGRA